MTIVTAMIFGIIPEFRWANRAIRHGPKGEWASNVGKCDAHKQYK